MSEAAETGRTEAGRAARRAASVCWLAGLGLSLVSIWSWLDHDKVWRVTGAVGVSLLLVADLPERWKKLRER